MAFGQILVGALSLALIAPSATKILRTYVAGRRTDLRIVIRRGGRAVELKASDADHAELFLRDYLKTIPVAQRAVHK